MNTNDNERRKWDALIAKNKIVVCTPEILHQCLRHSFITMDKINLLVFDEAHHAKKNHPYAKIIGDFYKPQHGATTQARPRVFGMTASPIDAKVNLVLASQELERLLDCKIATYELKEEFKNKANEMVLPYDQLRETFPTRLHLLIEKEVGDLPLFKRLFETALGLSSTLGTWAAEKFWDFALRSEEKNKLVGRLERDYGKSHSRHNVSILDEQAKKLQKAHDIVFSYQFRAPRMSLDDLSTKVYELIDFLDEYYSKELGNRCIIFVEMKATARMLVEIFEHLGPSCLRPGLLTGHAAKEGDMHVSFRQQVLTMTKFRKGEINCLFATSVAEEGLDVPDCNLVIRFDLYTTVIKYVQSKGRARHKNSKFVDLLERGNLREASIRQEARQQEWALTQWIARLDPERKLGGNDNTVGKDQSLGRYFVHEKSQAKLTYWSALGVLSLLTSTLVSNFSGT